MNEFFSLWFESTLTRNCFAIRAALPPVFTRFHWFIVTASMWEFLHIDWSALHLSVPLWRSHFLYITALYLYIYIYTHIERVCKTDGLGFLRADNGTLLCGGGSRPIVCRTPPSNPCYPTMSLTSRRSPFSLGLRHRRNWKRFLLCTSIVT